jgi:hypothetical protein
VNAQTGDFFCHEARLDFDSAMPKVRANGLVGPDVCRPDNVARRAAPCLCAKCVQVGQEGDLRRKERLSRFWPVARRSI